MKKTEIYKVTFGMEYNTRHVPIYTNTITVYTKNKSSFEVPVYAEMKDEKLYELCTGTEIPMIRGKDIPGFGAYLITRVYTPNDYSELNYHLSKISKDNLEEYINSFNRRISYFNSIKEQFNSTHRDSFGEMSIPNPERDNYFSNNYQKCILEVKRKIKDLKTGQYSLF